MEGLLEDNNVTLSAYNDPLWTSNEGDQLLEDFVDNESTSEDGEEDNAKRESNDKGLEKLIKDQVKEVDDEEQDADVDQRPRNKIG